MISSSGQLTEKGLPEVYNWNTHQNNQTGGLITYILRYKSCPSFQKDTLYSNLYFIQTVFWKNKNLAENCDVCRSDGDVRTAAEYNIKIRFVMIKYIIPVEMWLLLKSTNALCVAQLDCCLV